MSDCRGFDVHWMRSGGKDALLHSPFPKKKKKKGDYSEGKSGNVQPLDPAADEWGNSQLFNYTISQTAWWHGRARSEMRSFCEWCASETRNYARWYVTCWWKPQPWLRSIMSLLRIWLQSLLKIQSIWRTCVFFQCVFSREFIISLRIWACKRRQTNDSLRVGAGNQNHDGYDYYFYYFFWLLLFFQPFGAFSFKHYIMLLCVVLLCWCLVWV